jgi:histone-lysine N-methyltransferase SETD8
MGRGIFTRNRIAKGNFVLEYEGQVIEDFSEVTRREDFYRKNSKGLYMAVGYALGRTICIDPTSRFSRTLGRLVNHSPKGNLHYKVVQVKIYSFLYTQFTYDCTLRN